MSGDASTPLTELVLEARIAALRLTLKYGRRIRIDGRPSSIEEAATLFATFLITGAFSGSRP